MFRSSICRDVVILALVCSVVFWWRLGRLGLIDPDEPFYAQTAREMVASGDWLTPQIFGQPQFEKPIFFYWLNAAAYKVCGETEFAGRLPAAIPATLLVGLVYAFGIGFAGRRAALASALILATGLEFAIMSRLMLTDIALALFIAGALFAFWQAQQDETKRARWLMLHFACGGMAALTKGPMATLVTFLAIVSYAWVMHRPWGWRGKGFWAGLAIYVLIAVPWYAAMLWKFGWTFFDEFFIHENWDRLIRAEHPANNHWWYYPALLAVGSLPWMPVLAIAVNRTLQGFRHDSRLVFLWSWILSSLVFLSIVQSKLPSYIFYLFVPLGLVSGMVLEDLLTHGFRTPRERKLAIGCAIFQCIVTLAAPLISVARPFATPALGMGLCLLVALVFIWRDRWRGAIAAYVVATAALIGGALVFSVDHVERYSSARPVARAMMEGQDGREPLIAGKFLARGIHFYTHRPVWVLANKAQPFWTPHPLPVIEGRDALGDFVDEYGAVRVTIRRSELPLWQKSELVTNAGEPEWFGDNAVLRLVSPD